MITNPELRRAGIAHLQGLFGGGAAEALAEDMEGLCPDFTEMSIEWGWVVMGRGVVRRLGVWFEGVGVGAVGFVGACSLVLVCQVRRWG